MPSVEFTSENILRCQCGRCLVQAQSSCFDEARTALAKAVEEDGATPEPGRVPSLYCSSGMAFCGDLDFLQNCQCGECTVHAENWLSKWKYCQLGSAESIDTNQVGTPETEAGITDSQGGGIEGAVGGGQRGQGGG